jgi:signal transduction histidine kinase
MELDFPSVLKATQALSGEISFEKLIHRMMSVVAESAGAQRGALILEVAQSLRIGAEIGVESGVTVLAEPRDFEQNQDICRGVVQYVARTMASVVLDDAAGQGPFTNDPDVARRRPRSVLCVPLLHQARLKGVLYLENNLTTGAFTEHRLTLLGILCSQMAISIENAQMYAGLERLVEERTAELREAQERLMKVEKYATEVRMAGGFAHEMRNALSSALVFMEPVYSVDEGSVRCICDDTGEKLKDILLLAQAELPPDSRPRATGMVRGIYQNEKLLLTALAGVRRNIERSLGVTEMILDYSRLGFEQPGRSRISMQALVDSILRERDADLSANRVAMVVDVDPSIVMVGNESHFHSILNNLVANARDAVVETKDDRARQIRVHAGTQGPDFVVVEVTDNGVGIAEEHLARIFHPFFSTKPDTGTGLGMGIIDKLASLYGGVLEVESEVGRGTTIRIRFPAPDNLPPASSAPASLRSRGVEQQGALVAERG